MNGRQPSARAEEEGEHSSPQGEDSIASASAISSILDDVQASCRCGVLI